MRLITLFFALFLLTCQQVDREPIIREYIEPASGYTQAVCTYYNGVKTIHISGQVGEGDDLASQMKNALQNIKVLLEKSGASFKDVVKMNHYIVNYKPEDLAVFRDTRKEIMGSQDMPASTLVGVKALFSDKYLIEIDAVAMIKE